MADNSSHGSGGQSAKDQGNAKRAKLNSAIAPRSRSDRSYCSAELVQSL